jgi:hypothetical protein
MHQLTFNIDSDSLDVWVTVMTFDDRIERWKQTYQSSPRASVVNRQLQRIPAYVSGKRASLETEQLHNGIEQQMENEVRRTLESLRGRSVKEPSSD